jgi:hypothetical protein
VRRDGPTERIKTTGIEKIGESSEASPWIYWRLMVMEKLCVRTACCDDCSW